MKHKLVKYRKKHIGIIVINEYKCINCNFKTLTPITGRHLKCGGY